MKKILLIFFILICSKVSYAKSINNYEDLDLTSKPKKVLSKSKTKALWNAYNKAKECFEHPTYGEGFGYKLTKQKGIKHTFKRLKKIDSEISKLNKIKDIYNKIRSVDDDEYPRAYIHLKYFKIEFSKAKFSNGKLICESTIKKHS